MNFHSYSCYNHLLHDYTAPCTCHVDIQAGDFVRYYPDLADDNVWIDGHVIETFMNPDKELKLKGVQHPVKAVQCVLITFKNAA